jgi:putative DNA primase/helicase
MPAIGAQDAGADVGSMVHGGQARIAYRLAESNANKLMYVHGIGWYAWDGRRWAGSQRGEPKRAVLAVFRDCLADSLIDKTLRTDVGKCESAAGIAGVLDIAAALEPFAHTVADLDSDPYLLNVRNGTLDLRTCELRAHDPADRITKVTRAGLYDSHTSGTQWQRFLEQALPEVEVRAYFQRVIGLALLGEVRENILPIATGTGGNGKGVAYGAILHALGDYAYAAENDLFTSARRNANAASPALMGLRGRRLVIVAETEREQPLAEALMKLITGGDPITARPLYGNPVSFNPSHTALLVTNNLPRVSGDDPAIWRRVRLIQFNVSFRDNPDTRLGERLRHDADAILAWALEGWRQYQVGGMGDPAQVTQATTAYQRASDAVTRFLDEECQVDNPQGAATTEALHTRWTVWAPREGVEPMSARALGLALDKRGYPSTKGAGGVRRRAGLGLKPDRDPDE